MHDPQTRGQTIVRALAGEPLAKISRDTGIPESTIRLWRDQAQAELQNPADSVPQKKELFHEAVWQFASVAVWSMTRWADSLGDPDYHRAHDPDKVAIAFGVLGDKVAGLAAAVETVGASRLDTTTTRELDGATAAA